jgi:uncharacterized protein YbjT (DUF2867 family)
MKQTMIYVADGGGYIGRELVQRLVKSGQRVRALVESPEEGETVKGPGTEVVWGDRRRAATYAHTLAGVDVAMLITRHVPDLFELEVEFINAAKAAGVGRLVKSSAFGATLDQQGAKLLHARSEQAVRQSGMKWTFLRPQFFMQNVLWFADEIKTKGTFSMAMKSGRIGMIDYRDIAAVAAKCLTETGHDGQIYNLSGPDLISMDDIAAKLSRAVGASIRYNDISSDEFQRHLLAMGWCAWHAEVMTRSYAGMSQGASAVLTDDVKRLLGREATSFDQVATDYAHFFTPDGPRATLTAYR